MRGQTATTETHQMQIVPRTPGRVGIGIWCGISEPKGPQNPHQIPDPDPPRALQGSGPLSKCGVGFLVASRARRGTPMPEQTAEPPSRQRPTPTRIRPIFVQWRCLASTVTLPLPGNDSRGSAPLGCSSAPCRSNSRCLTSRMACQHARFVNVQLDVKD